MRECAEDIARARGSAIPQGVIRRSAAIARAVSRPEWPDKWPFQFASPFRCFFQAARRRQPHQDIIGDLKQQPEIVSIFREHRSAFSLPFPSKPPNAAPPLSERRSFPRE